MNRQFLTIVLIFASISSIGQECFACDGDPTAIISGSYYKYVSRDEVLGFSGSNSHDNDQGEGSYCIVDYDWVWPSAAYDIWESLDAGKTASAKFDTTGEHLVRLYVKDDEYNWSSSDTCKVRVVEVSLSASSGYIPAGGVLVPINLSVSPTDNWSYCKVRLAVVGDYQSCIKIWKDESKQELVIGDGSYYEEWQPGDLPSTLYVEGVSPTPPGADVDLFLKYLHYYGEVSQSSGNHVDFVVVGVGKVVDENSDEGPLYVCIDDSVNLEAIPNPYDASFPAGQPVWSIVGEPNESTASISPASGVTTTLSGLTVAGNYEIKAACGTSYDLITVTAVKIMSETVSTEPNDRSRTLLGIGEQVICWLEPSVVANWSVTGSGGDVDQQNSSWTTFTAVKSNDSPQYATVHAELPTSESECTLEFTVIKPTGEINVWDDSLDRAELGPPNLYMSHWIVFYAYVQPDTVSFYNVNFRENIPLNEWYWPDGTYDSYGEPNGLIKTFDVNYSNRWPDSCSDYNKPVSRLNDPNVGPIDFTIEANIPEEFQDDEGNWHAFLPNGLHKHFYRASDYKSKSAIIDDNTATAPEWMGPYKTTGSW